MKYGRKIRNFLLQPKTQLKYIYCLAALIIAPQLIFFFTLNVILKRIGLELEVQNVSHDFYIFLTDNLSRLTIYFSFSIFITLLIIAYGTLVISHRFFGPMYVIKKYLTDIRDGQPLTNRELRKDDEMKEIFQLIKEVANKTK